MVAKALWVSMLVVGLLAVGGLGYSAVMLTATVTVNGSAGTWSVSFSGPLTYQNSTTFYPLSSAVICTGPSTGSGNTLTVTAGNLGPGDWCAVSGNISNTGSIPAEFTGVTFSRTTSVYGCWQWSLVQPTATGTSVVPGGMMPFQILLELKNTPPNCQGVTGTFTWVFNFVVGSGQKGEPA